MPKHHALSRPIHDSVHRSNRTARGLLAKLLPLPKDSSVLSVIELFAQLADLGLRRGESAFDLLPVKVR